MPELTFNTPPQAGQVEIQPAVASTLDDLRAVITAEPTDPEGAGLGLTYTWTRDGMIVPGVLDLMPASATAKGQVWRVEVVAADVQWESEPFAAEITIGNAPPAVTSVRVLPEAPTSNEDLYVEVDADDPDDDALTYVIAWTRDGVAVPDLDDETVVPNGLTRADEIWQATVTPSDDLEAGDAASASVKVGNTRPTLAGVRIAPDNPTVEDSIRAELLNPNDVDGDPLTATIEWLVDGVIVETDAVTSELTYLNQRPARGQTVQARARVNDGWVDSASAVSSTLTVDNAIPRHDTTTLSVTEAWETTSVGCVVSGQVDADGDPLTLVYDWTVDGAWQGVDQQIIDGGWFNRDQIIGCRASVYDGIQHGDWIESETLTVDNSVPELSAATLNTTSPTVSDQIWLGSYTATDADPGDTVSLTYVWYVEGTAVGTGSVHSMSSYSRGDEVYVVATPGDGTTRGTAVTSDVATVANSVPSITSVSIDPTSPTTNDDVTVSATGWTDADLDAASYTYEWRVDGVTQSETSDTLDSSAFTKDAVVLALVTPTDAYDSGTALSTSVTVANTEPVAWATNLSSSPESCDVIQLDGTGSTDDDGDALTYSWRLPTKPVTSKATVDNYDDDTADMPTFQLDAAGVWVFRVVVDDGDDTDGDVVTVTSVLRASNTDPVADPGADDSDSDAVACSWSGTEWVCPDCSDVSFTLDGAGSSDDDGDPLNYAWVVLSSDATATIDDADAETTTLTVSDLAATYGTTSYEVEVQLGVSDCAEGTDSDTVVFTVDCTGF
jgi:hypothetical protein